MSFLRLSRIALALSTLLVAASVAILVYPGPRLSIEFTGGTLMEFRLPQETTKESLSSALQSFQNPTALEAGVSVTRDGTYFVRTRTLSNEEHQALAAHLRKTISGEITELQYTTIGPTVGSSLKRSSTYAILAAVVAIILYIAFAFRRMPRDLNPWMLGISAILAMVHDVLLTMGIFTILSHYTSFQFDTLFVSALLSIMGQSVNDTVVIFDRSRDNLFLAGGKGDVIEIIVRSLKQSFTRTFNMGIAVMVMLFSLFFFGAESIRWFILAIIVGTMIGNYSSYFVATPLVIVWRQFRMRAHKR